MVNHLSENIITLGYLKLCSQLADALCIRIQITVFINIAFDITYQHVIIYITYIYIYKRTCMTNELVRG